MQGTRGAIRSGGDAAAGARRHPADAGAAGALFRRGEGRRGRHRARSTSTSRPSTARLRVMAVAWTKDRVGSATADVIVRDPVVLAGTLPRFLSVGDQSRFFMQLDNVEGPAGDYTVDLDVSGPVIVAATRCARTRAARRGRQGRRSSFRSRRRGRARRRSTSSCQGRASRRPQRFALAHPARHVGRSCAGWCGRSRPAASLTVSRDLVADILPGTGAVSVSVSPLAALDVPGLLQALDRYPYGCSEQVVSRALPLLYVNKLAREASTWRSIEKADERVRERHRARARAPGLERLLRPVVGRRRRHLARRLRDRFPDPRAGARLRRAAAGVQTSRSTGLRNFVANTTEVEGTSAEHRLCGLCAGAQRPAGHGRSALSRGHQAR